MKKITMTMALAAMTAMNVNAQNGTTEAFDFKSATNYYLIYLDGETSEANIPAERIAGDYRVDDTVHFLYIWENTYVANTAIGPNSNGVPGEFLDFTVGNVGWSGFGFAGIAPGKNMSGIDDSYYLHFAMKANDASVHASHMVIINKDPNVAKIVIGNKPFVSDGVAYDPIGDFERDGEWYTFDIPVKTLAKMGLSFANETATKDNVFSMLSGGVEGTNICLDAIFFYQKADDNGIEAARAAADDIRVGNGMVEAEGLIELYDLTGKLVERSVNTLNVCDLNAGVYLVKAGEAVRKIAIR